MDADGQDEPMTVERAQYHMKRVMGRIRAGRGVPLYSWPKNSRVYWYVQVDIVFTSATKVPYDIAEAVAWKLFTDAEPVDWFTGRSRCS